MYFKRLQEAFEIYNMILDTRPENKLVTEYTIQEFYMHGIIQDRTLVFQFVSKNFKKTDCVAN